jgi:hypothetical protein
MIRYALGFTLIALITFVEDIEIVYTSYMLPFLAVLFLINVLFATSFDIEGKNNFTMSMLIMTFVVLALVVRSSRDAETPLAS